MYQVKKRFARGAETFVAEFKVEQEAEIFIKKKLEEDARLKVNTAYCLYEGADLVREFTQQDIDPSSISAETSVPGQQKSSGQRFSPSPLHTAPRPKGFPQSGFKNKEEGEEKEK